MIGLDVEGQSFRGLGNQIIAELAPGAEEAVRESADIAKASIKGLLGNVGQPIPGAPPRKRSGELKDSIRTTPIAWKQDGPTRLVLAGVVADEWWSRLLEHGTQTLPAFPHFRPGLERARTRINARLERM